MIVKYNADISAQAICTNLKRLINQTYKLLPNREENIDWQKPLETIIEEIAGMDRILSGQHDILFPLLCKLEGLFCYDKEDDFQIFRRTIFECLSLMGNLKNAICQD